jgi:CDP-diacylglycerol--glycerol-3-phosphate 3-phosphatidyltransferase
MTISNSLTLLRIILTPVCVVFLFLPIPHKEYYAAGVFLLAAITDGLDGYVARARKETSAFGKAFDPLADKILIGAALLSLYKLGKVALWIILVILGRELLITLLRFIAQKKELSIAASIWGKIKTVTQIFAVIGLILDLPGARILLWAAVFFTVFSALDYVCKWKQVFLPSGSRR